MATHIKITTTADESEALAYLAAVEMRTPADQLRWLLRQELLRRGLIDNADVGHEDQDCAKRTSIEGDL